MIFQYINLGYSNFGRATILPLQRQQRAFVPELIHLDWTQSPATSSTLDPVHLKSISSAGPSMVLDGLNHLFPSLRPQQ